MDSFKDTKHIVFCGEITISFEQAPVIYIFLKPFCATVQSLSKFSDDAINLLHIVNFFGAIK